MKKKLGILFVVLVILVTIISVVLKKSPIQEVQEVSAEPEKEIPVEWHGNYIWDTSTENNTWMCFRKKVDVKEDEIKDIVAQIAVDSKYWLYINGKMVVREGQVKRGETKESIYYDQVDLTKYFIEGENTIAILVWYWGDVSFSHSSSGQGALLFQTKIGENYLVSDDTWKVSKHKSYLQDPVRPNYRIIEYNVYYDAALWDEEWVKPEYDDLAWGNATVLNVGGSAPWGNLIKRDIPQFKNYDLKEYENMAEYVNYETTKKETLEMTMPYNMQFTPYLKVEAQKGLKITIKTDQYADINGDSVMCTYFTKDGIQEFECLAWINGEKAYYQIPKGVKIISLGYRQTSYDSEMTGSFKSDDKFLNKLWLMAGRTLQVNMRDSYMDCPNRERAQWFGDMSVEMLEAMYALDTNSYDLYEKGVKTSIGWSYGDVLLTVAPLTADNLHLPVQMLLGINSMYEYYEYTGKKEFLEYVYPYVKNYLDLWYVKESDGLVHSSVTYPIWEWGDSSGEIDYEALENAWYYYAMSKTAKMAELLGYEEDKLEFDTRLQNLKSSFNKLWTENGYKTANVDYIDERVNAVAILSGLADSDKYEVISDILTTSYQSTVFMEKYILEALCELGKIEEAQERIKYRYEEMVNGEKACSTLWESWNPDTGTRNHAWAGGPLIIMSKYFAGIEPLESGYEKISIKPQFGDLNEISANVTTIKGDVKFEGEKTEKSVRLDIEVPTMTRVAVPKISGDFEISVNGKRVYKKGKEKWNRVVEYDSEDDAYVYVYVESGSYEIDVDAI